jgi:hypothetical protein
MKRSLAVCTALAVVLATSLCGCSANPPEAAVPQQPTAPATEESRGADQPTTAEGATDMPTPQPQPEGPAKTPTRTPSSKTGDKTPQPSQGTPEIGQSPSARWATQTAKEDLSRKLGLSPEEISLVSVEAVPWPDASLGCPQPGMMYAQVITPGFSIVLEAAGQTYDYHADERSLVVLCQGDGWDVEPLMPVAPHGIPGKPRTQGD